MAGKTVDTTELSDGFFNLLSTHLMTRLWCQLFISALLHPFEKKLSCNLKHSGQKSYNKFSAHENILTCKNGQKDVVKLLLDYLDRVIELNAGDNNG